VSSDIMAAIDGYYDSVTFCVRNVGLNVSKIQDEYVILGWNDLVDERHKTARKHFFVGF